MFLHMAVGLVCVAVAVAACEGGWGSKRDLSCRGLDAFLIVFVFQDLNLCSNFLRNLPDELSALGHLEKLDVSCNKLEEVPTAVLSGMTALSHLSLRNEGDEDRPFKVSSSLLPILHPGLRMLDLVQSAEPWDKASLPHLREARAELARRTPTPTFTF
jgi:hypothetical protein